MSGITERIGTEGPRLDPYQYIERTVRRGRKHPITIHMGLSMWIQIGDCEKIDIGTLTIRQIENIFETMTGFTFKQVDRILRKLHELEYRRHKAHGGFRWACGFPGEELCFCKCGHVIDSTFDEGAII
jgi:hypothetical protein